MHFHSLLHIWYEFCKESTFKVECVTGSRVEYSTCAHIMNVSTALWNVMLCSSMSWNQRFDSGFSVLEAKQQKAQ